MQDQLTPEIVFWAGACIALLGTAGAAWGLRTIWIERQRIAQGHHASGKVVENRVSTDTDNSTLFHPIVEFTTREGRSVRVECSWSTELKYTVGTAVPICYNPERPEDADIVGATRVGTILLVAFAAIVTGSGVLLLVAGALGFPPGH
jgi:hypothetical protein